VQDALCGAKRGGYDGWTKFALPNFSNVKDGQGMASRKLSPEQLQAVSRLAKQWGKIIVKQAFGEQGPGLDVDFALMEEVASAAARGLTEGALEAATAQQGQLLGAKQPCPHCGKLCTVASEERPMRAKGGSVALREPKCYCPTCRRDFFPSTSGAEAGRAWLQPDDHAPHPVRDGRSEIA
jgi:hypothetical protein